MEEFDDGNTEGGTGERSQKLKLVENKNNNEDDTDEDIDNDDEVTTIEARSAKRNKNIHDDEISVENGSIPVKKKQRCNTARGSVPYVGRATQKWNSNYRAVKKYVESHNGRYPNIYQNHMNCITGINLGRWVKNQKRAYNKTNNMKLTQQKMTDLEKLSNWRWSHSRTKQQKSISRKSGGKDCPEKQIYFVNSSSSKSASTLRTAALNIQEEETAKAKETSAHTGINMTLAEAIKAAEEKTQQDGDKNKDPSFVWV